MQNVFSSKTMETKAGQLVRKRASMATRIADGNFSFEVRGLVQLICQHLGLMQLELRPVDKLSSATIPSAFSIILPSQNNILLCVVHC